MPSRAGTPGIQGLCSWVQPREPHSPDGSCPAGKMVGARPSHAQASGEWRKRNIHPRGKGDFPGTTPLPASFGSPCLTFDFRNLGLRNSYRKWKMFHRLPNEQVSYGRWHAPGSGEHPVLKVLVCQRPQQTFHCL